MHYSKPQVLVVRSALMAVQGQFLKLIHHYPDFIVYRTAAAYEADE